LPIWRGRVVPGTVLCFEGNPSRPRFQSARLDKSGRCPSLPDLPNALFTSIAGVPGDSGAPLGAVVAEVVGLVHGGARCHIATPADTLVRLVDRVLERDDVRIAARSHSRGSNSADGSCLAGRHAEAAHLRVERLTGDAEAAGGGGLGGLLLQGLAGEREVGELEVRGERLVVGRGI